jgi:hypothetical protein
MLHKLNLKYILVGMIAILLLTISLNFFDRSSFQMNEYSNICHSIYDEKVWIDTCYLPTIQNKNTYGMIMKIEIVGIIGLALLYFKKFHFKN